MKPRPRVGDKLFEVEWCASIPKDENGDRDHDSADFRFSRFKTKEAAEKYAMSVLPKDAYGSVSVTPIEFVAYDEDDISSPHVGFWEHTGDSTVFDTHAKDCNCHHCVDEAQRNDQD